MKILFKSVLIIIAAFILFSFTSCNNNSTNTKKPTNFKVLTFTDELVYQPKPGIAKISEYFENFNGSRNLDVTVVTSSGIRTVGSGNIVNGLLSFSVSELVQGNLLDSDSFFKEYFSDSINDGGWYSDGNNIKMFPPEAKANILSLITGYADSSSQKIPNEGVFKEGFDGNHNSLSGEYVYYVYVDRNCTITAQLKEDVALMYRYSPFTINLKAGWNTLCKTETFITGGASTYAMELKNPELLWLIQPIPTN